MEGLLQEKSRCHQPVVSPWANDFTFLGFSFLIGKVRWLKWLVNTFQLCNSVNLLLVVFVSIQKPKASPEQMHWLRQGDLEQASFPDVKGNARLQIAACLTNYCLHLFKQVSRQVMPGKPNDLIQVIELPRYIKSYMQIQGADWARSHVLFKIWMYATFKQI